MSDTETGTSDETSAAMRQGAAALREMDNPDVPVSIFYAAVADWLEETARQYDAPPCDDPSGVCTPCERREDFNDALRAARAALGEFPAAAEAVVS